MCQQGAVRENGEVSLIMGERDLSGWMSALPGEMPLAEVTLPGTHNSASYVIRDGHYAAVVAASRCQSRPLQTQLRLGVRFLDFRTRPCGTLCHGRVSCGLTLRGALDICAAFLRKNPSEVLVARIKDETGKAARGVDDLVRDIVESADHPLYLQMRLPSIREVRGRIVVLCDWADGMLGVRWAGPSMRIQDEYWQSTGSKKWHVIRRHLEDAEPSPDFLQVHFTSATHLPRKVPISIARSVNPKLADYLRLGPCHRFLGVVCMDFPSAYLCELIIRKNAAWTLSASGMDPFRGVRAIREGCPKVCEWLDDLQCELKASATRADVALLVDNKEELEERVKWLSRVYLKVVVEHAYAELGESGLDDFAFASPIAWEKADEAQNGVPSPKPKSASPPGSRRKGQLRNDGDDDCGVERGPRKRGLLARFGACLPGGGGSGATQRAGSSAGERRRLVPGAASAPASPPPLRPSPPPLRPSVPLSTPAGLDGDAPERTFSAGVNNWLDNLKCELEAAASRADAAMAERPDELPERLQWLSRVYVRVVVDGTRARLAAPGAESALLGVECPGGSSSSSDEEHTPTPRGRAAAAALRLSARGRAAATLVGRKRPLGLSRLVAAPPPPPPSPPVRTAPRQPPRVRMASAGPRRLEVRS